jgi:membrane protein implicated in regulation of membrane protease activity
MGCSVARRCARYEQIHGVFRFRRAAGNAPRSRAVLGLGTPLQIVAMIAVLVVAAALALTLNGYFVFVIAGVAMLAICGVGLNLLLGLTGQVRSGMWASMRSAPTRWPS